MKRLTLALLVSAAASVTACNDVTPPDGSRAIAPPSRPSLQSIPTLGNDITYDIPGGTIRLFDLTISAPGGRIVGQRAFVNPGSTVAMSGKWKVVAAECDACIDNLNIFWSAELTDVQVPLKAGGVAVTVGNAGTFELNVTPTVLRQSFVVFVVQPDGPSLGYSPIGVPTGGSPVSGGMAPFGITVTNDDVTAPVLAPTVTPAEIPVGGTAIVAPNATDNLSGIASTACGAVDASTVGQFTVQCTATDNVGNTATANASYTVKYGFGGFQSPLNSSAWNSAKAGSAVPVKFNLGGNAGLAILSAGYPTSRSKACPSASTPVTSIVELAANGNGGGLQYDATTKTYTYVWKTEKSWSGTCRTFVLKLTDGVEHTADFQFK